MQTDNNELYKITAKATNKSESTYKDIGNFIFKALANNMKKPKSLIINLKGVGAWYLRRQRMEIHIDNVKPEIDSTTYEEKEELKTLFAKRLEDYKNYIEERNTIRNERYKTQSLVEVTNRENKNN